MQLIMKINQKFSSNTKSVRGELFKFFRDILRDKNSNKYSLTKFVACLGVILLIIVVIFGIIIMVRKNEIDHILIVEIIGFVLTLLGFKNSFGYSTNGRGEQQIITKNNTDDNNIDSGNYNGDNGDNNYNGDNYHNDINENNHHNKNYPNNDRETDSSEIG